MRQGKQEIRSRQVSALNLLEKQLKEGTKPEKINHKTTSKIIPLSESDKKRINSQIEILKKRI